MITRQEIAQKIQALQLPAPPATVARLLHLISSDKTSGPEIGAALELDPGLASRVLRLANSAALGGAGTVQSIPEAVLRVGLEGVHDLVLSLALAKSLHPAHLDYRPFWRHSLAVAHCAQTLQAHAHGLSGPHDESYTAGLLHDIGIIVLDHALGETYANVFATALATGRPLLEVENEMLAFDHTRAGELLLRAWKLPECLVSAVRHHHSPWHDSSPLVQLTYLADFVCNNQGLHHGSGYFPSTCYDTAWVNLGIADTQLPEIIANAQLGLQRAEEILRAAA